MKKTTVWGRKLATQGRLKAMQAKAQAAQQVEKDLRTAIRADVQSLQVNAGIHTYTGAHAANTINLTGRLCFIVAAAATEAGFTPDHPDMRIIRGLASSLGDLAANHHSLGQHRASLQSGLAAVDRLLPECDDIALAFAAQQLEYLLDSTAGMGTADVQAAMGITS